METSQAPKSSYSLLRSFHDLSLVFMLLGGVLLLGIGCLRLLKPNDGLLQHRNHLLMFCGAITVVSLPAMAFIFAPVRRRIKQGWTQEFINFLAKLSFEMTSHSQDRHEFTPKRQSWLTFRAERICIHYHEGSAPTAEFPRYLLLMLPATAFVSIASRK